MILVLGKRIFHAVFLNTNDTTNQKKKDPQIRKQKQKSGIRRKKRALDLGLESVLKVESSRGKGQG